MPFVKARDLDALIASKEMLTASMARLTDGHRDRLTPYVRSNDVEGFTREMDKIIREASK